MKFLIKNYSLKVLIKSTLDTHCAFTVNAQA